MLVRSACMGGNGGTRLSEEPGLDQGAARKHGGCQIRAGLHVLVVVRIRHDVPVPNQLQASRGCSALADVPPVSLLGVPAPCNVLDLSSSSPHSASPV